MAVTYVGSVELLQDGGFVVRVEGSDTKLGEKYIEITHEHAVDVTGKAVFGTIY